VCNLRPVPKEGKTIKIGVWFVWRKDTKQLRKWAQLWDLQTFKPYKTSDIYLPQYCKYQYQNSCLLDWACPSTISEWSGLKLWSQKAGNATFSLLQSHNIDFGSAAWRVAELLIQVERSNGIREKVCNCTKFCHCIKVWQILGLSTHWQWRYVNLKQIKYYKEQGNITASAWIPYPIICTSNSRESGQSRISWGCNQKEGDGWKACTYYWQATTPLPSVTQLYSQAMHHPCLMSAV
jgi:hypothetical protein